LDYWLEGMRHAYLHYDYDEIFQEFSWEWDRLDTAGNEAGAGIYLVKAISGQVFQTGNCLKLK
ncbi:MAG: hypothetical protein R6T89_06855, partial [Candidatus Syntrophosphaera sp.]